MTSRVLGIGAVALTVAVAGGCRKERTVSVVTPVVEAAPKPVVAAAPVPTHPFEEGYNFGYDLGKKQGAPRAKLPDDETVWQLAREQASGHPERNERWERGFSDGYTDGFRNVVTGQK